MNICIFCHDAYMSGANKSLFDWIKHDERDNFIIVLPHANSHQDFSQLSNVSIVNGNYFCLHKELAKKPLLYNIKKCVKNLYMLCFQHAVLRGLKKTLLKHDVDIIISNSFSVLFGAVVAKELDIPHFWHIREFMDLDHQITHKNPELVNDLVRYSNAIFISDVIKAYYLKRYEFKNYTVIYNQIHIDERFDKEKKLFKDNTIRIIMSGTLQENKGQKEAIAATKKIASNGTQVRLDIYGNGPQKNELETMIKKSKGSDYIVLKGHVDNLEEIRKTYDIALVCSSNEALGRVTVESMGSGCITIGADAGCTSMIIQKGINGFLYELHNVDDLVNKIMYVYNNKDEMNSIRLRARKYCEDNFSKPIYEKIVSYINNCI